jgi:hypothetical protein
MELPATIVGIAQEYDFKNGDTTNFMIFTVDGVSFRALVSEETTRKLVGFAATGVMPAAPTPVSESFDPELTPQRSSELAYEKQADGSDALVFGGATSEPPPQEVPMRRAPPAPIVPPLPAGHARPITRRKVSTDESGYPVIEGGGVNPRDISVENGTGVDEEGIGQA